MWITINGIIGSGLVLTELHQNVLLLLLIAEAVVMFLIIPMIIGIIVPISIVVLTIKMWRRESKSIGNLLLPIVMLTFLVVDWIHLSMGRLPDSWIWLKILGMVYPILSIYLAWQFGIFFLSSWVYGRRVRKQRANYYVVLGAGLIQGEHVGKLLGNRILAAVKAVRDNETILVFQVDKVLMRKFLKLELCNGMRLKFLVFRLSGQCLKINQEQLTKTWFFFSID